MRKLLLAFCITLRIFASTNLIAQEWEEITKSLPIPYENSTNFYFGSSVSIDGNYAVVGEYGYNSFTGCAIVFYFNGSYWETQARLTTSDGDVDDYFGFSVSIHGDNIVIGAYQDDDNGASSGSAYVFTKPINGWENMTETAKLIASDASAVDLFGYSVSISNDYVLIGAYRDDDYGSESGSAYIYSKPLGGWENMTETAKLSASDAAEDDRFGYSVSIFSDYVVVGAYRDDDNGSESGSAYIFTKPETGWVSTVQTAKLTASDGSTYDYFGSSVSISVDNIVVGAYGDDDNGSYSGSAYVFTKPETGWTDMTQTAKLTASDGAVEDYFGYSIGISGDNIVIGAYKDDVDGNESGSAYVFTKPEAGWVDMTQTAKIVASDGTLEDYFGFSVSISGANIIVGANEDDSKGENSGSVYVFEKSSNDWSSTETNKILPKDYTNIGDSYGSSISVDGNYAVIGASGYKDRGCAYVFYKNGNSWELQAILTASDGEITDRFGNSVSIFGDYIVVGTRKFLDYGYANKNGSVYVFEKPTGGWRDMTETCKLYSSDESPKNAFGNSVDIYGDVIVVGTQRDDDNGILSGAAYVFEKPVNGWVTGTETAKLTASDGAIGDFFGRSVSISGNYIVIGAPEDNYNDNNSGSAYVFEKPENGWETMTETAKLTASDIAVINYFGECVSVSNECIVVGAHSGNYTGSAYVFEKPESGWISTTETAKFAASDATSNFYFGYSVDISDDIIVVGAIRGGTDGIKSGATYVFEKPLSGWISCTETSKLMSSDFESGDYFGSSVGISGDNIIVGAISDDDNGRNSGSVFFYKQKSDFDFKDNLCDGDDFIYSLLNQDVGASFQWQENSVSSWLDIAGETNDILVIPNVNLGMNGYQYRCLLFGTENDTSDIATLIVGSIFNQTETVTVCSGGNYTFPDGSIQTDITSQVVYTSNLQSISGCDSIIETTVNVNPIYNLTETVVINTGGSYTFPDGTVQNNITSQVIYTSNLQTILGCDSIIETTVNVDQGQECRFTKEVSVCSGSDYIFPDGTTQSNITSQVVHESILPSLYGCDTIIETTVNVNQGNETYLHETICEGETFQLDYAILSSPGLYGITLTNQFGCDSLVNLDLTVIELDVDLGRDKTIGINETIILDAGDDFETYLWSNDETSQTILIDGSAGVGSYTFNVLVTDENDCSETDAIAITISDVTDISLNNDLEGDIKLYPNPTSGKINIDYDKDINVEFYNLSGVKVLESDQKELDVSSLNNGTYIVLIRNNKDELLQRMKIIKE